MRLNDSEWTVMQAVWAVEGAVTARDVHAHVAEATDWSYSTVRTLLSRLAGKGALTEAKSGKQLVYVPELARGEAQRSALRSLVDRAFGGTFGSLVQHLASEEELSAAERDELIRMIEASDDERDRGRGTRR